MSKSFARTHLIAAIYFIVGFICSPIIIGIWKTQFVDINHEKQIKKEAYSFFYRISTSLLMELSNVFLVVPTAGMNRHLVLTSWRTQTLLLGFSPLTWSSGSFNVFDLSGRDIDARWAYPAPQSDDPRVKWYTRLVPLKNE